MEQYARTYSRRGDITPPKRHTRGKGDDPMRSGPVGEAPPQVGKRAIANALMGAQVGEGDPRDPYAEDQTMAQDSEILRAMRILGLVG